MHVKYINSISTFSFVFPFEFVLKLSMLFTFASTQCQMKDLALDCIRPPLLNSIHQYCSDLFSMFFFCFMYHKSH